MTTASLTLGMTSLLLLSSPLAQAETAAPCAANEVRISDDFYHPDGTAKRTVAGQVLPKFCPTGRPANRYHSCKKEGADSALDLLHRDIDAIKSALVLASNTYELPKLVEDELANPWKIPGAQNNFMMWFQGKKGGVDHVSEIYLPPPGKELHFADKDSGAVFSITSSGSGQHYTVAFRGSVSATDWQNNIDAAGLERYNLFLPRMYMRAISVGWDMTRLLHEAGKDCSAGVTYTGHSLGGGLALSAALMSGSRCNQKHDDVVLINSAMPSPLTENDEMLLSGKNSIGVVLDLNFEGEVLQRAQPHKAGFLKRLAKNTQVVRFSRVGDALTARDWENGDFIDRLGGTVATHSISFLLNEVNRWASTLPAPWPARIPYKQAMHACYWYEPLLQDGEGLKRKAPIKGEQYKKF